MLHHKKKMHDPKGGGAQHDAKDQEDPRVKNARNREHVKARAKNMIQLNYTQTVNTPTMAASNIISFTPKNIGLLKRFYLEVLLTFTTAAGTTSCALSPFGPANILSNISFFDYQNQQRINTSGWHLVAVDTFRANRGQGGQPLGAAQTSDTPFGYGNILQSEYAPATVAASTAVTLKCVFEVPIAYSDADLRGAIYMNTTGANTTLSCTLNPNFFVLNTGDPTQAVYIYAGTLPTVNSWQVNFYQNYMDQLPIDGRTGKVVLPERDLNTVYQLLATNYSGFTAGNPFGIPYSNLRQYLSTTLVYDNNGLNAGTDITNFGLQAANNTFLWQFDPMLQSYITRKKINADTPKGMYLFDHSDDPISTDQFGNMQLVVTPTSVNTGAAMLLGYEFFAQRQTISKASSLPSG